jgi:beta-lactamase superfamily II metal-dependent hydrolase
MQALMDAEPDLRADAMLWPHHGHEPEAVGRLASAVGARAVVVSDGWSPRPPPRPDWLKAGRVAYYRTGEQGAVTLELRPEGVRASTFAAGAVPPEEEPDEDADDVED